MALDGVVEGAELVVFEREDAVSRGLEIVKQRQRIELERAPQFAAVDHPGKIGSLDFAVDHRPGDAEAGGVDGVRAHGGGRLPRGRKKGAAFFSAPPTSRGKNISLGAIIHLTSQQANWIRS